MEFKIGDKLICIKTITPAYLDDERLILGESYIVDDIDWHFPSHVAVKLKGPYYFHIEWVPKECFSNLAEIRDKKLKELGI